MCDQPKQLVILTAIDPVGDQRCAWLADAAAGVGHRAQAVGFAAGEESSEATLNNRVPTLAIGSSADAFDEAALFDLLREAGITDNAFAAQLDRLSAAQSDAQTKVANGVISPAADGLAANRWFLSDYIIPMALRVLAAARAGVVRTPDVVIATTPVALLAALALKAKYGCRVVFDAQSFGPDAFLVHPRPRQIFHRYEAAAIAHVDAICFGSSTLLTQFADQYGSLPRATLSADPGGREGVQEALTGERSAKNRATGIAEGRLLVIADTFADGDHRAARIASVAAAVGYETRIFTPIDPAQHQLEHTDIGQAERLPAGPLGTLPDWSGMWSLVRTHRILPRWAGALRLFRKIAAPINRLLQKLLGGSERGKSLLPGLSVAEFFANDCVVRARYLIGALQHAQWAPEVVHASGPGSLLAAAAVRALCGARIVYDDQAHGDEAHVLASRQRVLFQAVQEHLLNQVDGASTVSEGLARQYNERYGHIVGFHVVPNALRFVAHAAAPLLEDVEVAANGRIRYLCEAQSDGDADLETLIDAWTAVNDNIAVLFISVPAGDWQDRLLQRAADKGKLDTSIFFLPPTPTEDPGYYARHCHVGIFPQRPGPITQEARLQQRLASSLQNGLSLLATPHSVASPLIGLANCGQIYLPSRAGSLTRALDGLAADQAMLEQQAQQSRWCAQFIYSLDVFFPTLRHLYEAVQPPENPAVTQIRYQRELKRILPDPKQLALAHSIAKDVSNLPKAASDYHVRRSGVGAPPFETEIVTREKGRRRRKFVATPLPTMAETQLDEPLAKTLMPPEPGQKAVLFIHNSYYHFYYLAQALRARGFHAVSVSLENPDGPNSNFYHGEDLNLWHPDDAVRKARSYDLMDAITQHFRAVHFHGAELSSLFESNYQLSARDGIPWDLLELKRRGVKIGHTISGCLTGQRQSRFYYASGGVCDKCVWQLRPDVCGEETAAAQNQMLEDLLDLNSLEFDWPADTSRRTAAAYYDPLTYCISPELWRPDLDIPDDMRFERRNDEILVFHSVGNFDIRAKNNRNIKGTGAVIRAIERLQSEGVPVRLIFKTGVPSRDMRFYQVQADIIVDQLNYGRNGATLRECMALGRPVITRWSPDQPEGVPHSKALHECPAIDANESTIYDVLKDLCENPDKRLAAGKASREFALAHFSNKACARRYELVYDRMMRNEPVWQADD